MLFHKVFGRCIKKIHFLNKYFEQINEKDEPKFIHILRTSDQMNKTQEDGELGGRILRLTNNQEAIIKNMTDIKNEISNINNNIREVQTGHNDILLNQGDTSSNLE